MSRARYGKRPAGIRQWLERRGFRAVLRWTTVSLPDTDLAVRVVTMNLRGGHTPEMALKEVERQYPGMHPALLRVMDPDPGRCQITMRVDDFMPYLKAYEELRSRR